MDNVEQIKPVKKIKLTALVTYTFETEKVDEKTIGKWKEYFQDMPIGLAMVDEVIWREVKGVD